MNPLNPYFKSKTLKEVSKKLKFNSYKKMIKWKINMIWNYDIMLIEIIKRCYVAVKSVKYIGND